MMFLSVFRRHSRLPFELRCSTPSFSCFQY
nr:MAG TPA: hypothetical protein [Bacteriophage sp.]